MVSRQYSQGDRNEEGFRPVAMPHRSDGVGNALRVLCPTCKTPLPDDMLALIQQIDAITE